MYQKIIAELMEHYLYSKYNNMHMYWSTYYPHCCFASFISTEQLRCENLVYQDTYLGHSSYRLIHWGCCGGDPFQSLKSQIVFELRFVIRIQCCPWRILSLCDYVYMYLCKWGKKLLKKRLDEAFFSSLEKSTKLLQN